MNAVLELLDEAGKPKFGVCETETMTGTADPEPAGAVNTILVAAEATVTADAGKATPPTVIETVELVPKLVPVKVIRVPVKKGIQNNKLNTFTTT
jgi:hypothetical protein